MHGETVLLHPCWNLAFYPSDNVGIGIRVPRDSLSLGILSKEGFG